MSPKGIAKKPSRSYSASAIKTLFARSGNLCAFPGCQVQIAIDRVTQEGTLSLGDIAHIYPISNSGPRSGSSQKDLDVNEVSNLMLLCAIHHRLVDGDPHAFPAEKLRRWKQSHESSILSAALTAKQEHDPKLLSSLRSRLHFDYSKPEDYREMMRLLAEHNLQNVFWRFVNSGADDNADLFHLGSTLARYFNIVARRQDAEKIFDVCLEMFPKVFPNESGDSRRMMASLLHQRYGRYDLRAQEIDFCAKTFGKTHDRTLQAEICKGCDLLRLGRLDSAQEQFADCSRSLLKGKDASTLTRANLDFQFGKLWFYIATRERQPKVCACHAVDYLRMAEAQFDLTNANHTTLAWVRFFLFKAAGLAGYKKEAERNYKLAKAFFGIAPITSICHYSDEQLRMELHLK